ncbi:MAG: LytR C-terminal domain-containing protein [Candidatus Berkelbacteria bacterium]|nr:LytR C-terminal domain-containing protein [Candidatus Berkelbacteria bacterium]
MAKSLDIIDPKKELEDKPKEEKDEFDHGFKEPSSGGGGIFYLIIGIIAVVVAVGSALYILYSGDRGSKEESTTPTVEETVTVQTSPSPTASVAATSSPTTTTFKYTDEKIRVANGNGISGEAAKIKKVLEDKGFKVESIGNASKTYAETIIFYKTGQEELANALKDVIKDYYTGKIENSDTTVGTYDAVIALGSK